MNNSFRFLRSQALSSRAQMMLMQSTNAPAIPRAETRPLLAVAIVPTFLFGLGLLMAISPNERFAISIHSADVSTGQGFIALPTDMTRQLN